MVIKFKCSGCGKGYKIRDDQAGEQIECPQCATLMKVPKATKKKAKPAETNTAAERQPNQTQKRRSGVNSGVKKKKKTSAGNNQKGILIGAGATGAVLLLGVLIFLFLPGEDAAEVPGENQVAAASPSPNTDAAAPPADSNSTPPATPANPPAAGAASVSHAKNQFGIQKYTGDQEEIKLPGVIEDLVAGGGGRYLVLYLKELKQIAIYDANEAQIVKTIPLETDDALIAAGAESFLIADRSKMMLEHWSFKTFEKEAEAPLPKDSTLHAMVLGYASKGPSLLSVIYTINNKRSHALLFLSLETLQHDPEISAASLNNLNSHSDMIFRASGDGKVFGILSPQYNGDVLGTLNLNLKSQETYFRRFESRKRESPFAKFLQPNANGSVLLSNTGLYSLQMYPRNMYPHYELNLVASTHPNYFVSFPLTSNSVKVYLTETGEPIAPLRVAPLGNVSDVLTRSRNNPQPRSFKDLLPLDKRIHYIPQADQVVTVPYTDDMLRIVPFSLTNTLRNSNKPYLFASSVAPQSCVKGTQLDYQLEVESSSPSVTYELSAGPKGMALSETGRLTWQVPDTFEEKNVYVIITLNSADKQTAFQTFRLYVHDQAKL